MQKENCYGKTKTIGKTILTDTVTAKCLEYYKKQFFIAKLLSGKTKQVKFEFVFFSSFLIV